MRTLFRIRPLLRAAGALALGVGMGWGAARAQSAPAQPKTMLMEPPAPLLPAMLGKLTLSPDGPQTMEAAGLTAQDQAVLNEDGLKRFARSEYGNSSGKDFR